VAWAPTGSGSSRQRVVEPLTPRMRAVPGVPLLLTLTELQLSRSS
jgi:hypothetical protein